jgi:hypothetical protein
MAVVSTYTKHETETEKKSRKKQKPSLIAWRSHIYINKRFKIVRGISFLYWDMLNVSWDSSCASVNSVL